MMTSDTLRSHLVILRVRMATADDLTAVQAASGEAQVSPPARRRIVLELHVQGAAVAEWRMTEAELGVVTGASWLADHAAGFWSAIGSAAASATVGAMTGAPRLIISEIRADWLRSALAPSKELPLHIAEGLKAALAAHAPSRSVLWLELAEPSERLSLLEWEKWLRAPAGVPLVRLPAHLLDPVSTHTTLDVLLTCSTGSAKPLIPAKRVVKLVQQILAATASGNRRVVHVFADDTYRSLLASAFKKTRIAMVEEGEPAGQQGVVLYRHPAEAPAEPPAAETLGAVPNSVVGSPEAAEAAATTLVRKTVLAGARVPSPSEHPWARWIRGALADRAIDIVHVIADGRLTESRAALIVNAEPWRVSVEDVPESETQGVRLGYVDAHEMGEFVTQFGAWGTFFSTAGAKARRAHRVLTHQLSRTMPGVFVAHDFEADSDARAIGELYRFLSEDRIPSASSSQSTKAGPPDELALAWYCHPRRIHLDLPHDASEVSDVAASYQAAASAIRTVMDLPDATPAWLAASQRYLEQTLAGYLESSASSPESRAAREGVGKALSVAFDALAHNADVVRSEASADRAYREPGS